MSREPSIINKPAGITLVKLINPLIEHSRFYDRLDKEVDARGSMAMLWFYRSHLASIFNSYCLGTDDEEELKKSKEDEFNSYRQGRYWMIFVHIFSQALQNIHRQRPEEVESIGEAALAKAESYINAATSKIEVSLRCVLGQFSAWSNQIQPLAVAEHFVQNKGKREQWGKLPGFESYWPNRYFLKKLFFIIQNLFFCFNKKEKNSHNTLKYNLDVIGDMCAAFDEVDTIIIYNQKLFPAGYLHQLVRDFFHSELRLIVQETQQTMVRPSRFVSRLDRLFRACSRLHSYINIDLERMIRDLLYADFYDDSVGGVGGPLGVPKKQESTSGVKEVTKKNDRLIHDIRDWYVNIVDSRCAAPGSGAVYSPILNGFYDLQSNRTAPLEDYCSLTELESLCRVIGPSGVRVIDIEIVKIGHAAMVKIAKTLRDNKDLIQGVEMEKFFGEERWKNVVTRFKGLDIISKQGIVVGSVILFRKLLRKALLYHKRIYVDSFSHLSLDVGIVSTFSDNVMRNVFYELGKDDSSTKLWQYIPLVFGIAFANPFWRGCRYSMEFGALDNNGFAIADCVQNLISIFCDPQEHRKMKLQFLGIAGRSLLYLKKSRNDPIVNHLYLLLDYFVSLSKDLTLHDLQAVSIPYDVIRAQIVKIYGDASGMKTDDPLNTQEDDIKQEETGNEKYVLEVEMNVAVCQKYLVFTPLTKTSNVSVSYKAKSSKNFYKIN
ncbi:hypothetical protein RFI_22147 [Reticulomyxa filosa]|uniref:CYRIA/CYRIB Rac1 binding domain-containing protein n=1 Tax=Reticulomyxa filosa TaxID=46433 RepID=X6MP47_RETFI|nr:hypothetical protein RFI_22147 [Reticulomyxa filosa]|eukprot:ETO15217.1 hypothetical protein RFI_22147 [Reticulomyxa filosa]